ncbi:MAG: hypothetical protein ACLP4V_08470 [Methylocella sp.]
MFVGDDDDDLPGGAGAQGAADEPILDDDEPQETDAATSAEQHTDAGTDTGGSSRAGRREDAIRELLAEQRLQREQLQRDREELAAERARLTTPPPVDLNAMDPETRLRYEADQRFNQLRSEGLRQSFESKADLDQIKFATLLSRQPRFSKYEDQVEKLFLGQLNNAMRQGRVDQIVTRERILINLIGEEDVKNGGKKLAAAQEKGRQNIERQRTPAANLSGNVRRSSDGGKSPADAAAERMRKAGVLID